MRCFVAIELAESVRTALARLANGLPRGGIRWCTVDQLHVTLKFLGDVGDELTPAICRIVSEVAASMAPFELTLRVPTAWSDDDYDRVVMSVLSRFILRYRAFQAYGQHL